MRDVVGVVAVKEEVDAARRSEGPIEATRQVTMKDVPGELACTGTAKSGFQIAPQAAGTVKMARYAMHEVAGAGAREAAITRKDWVKISSESMSISEMTGHLTSEIAGTVNLSVQAPGARKSHIEIENVIDIQDLGFRMSKGGQQVPDTSGGECSGPAAELAPAEVIMLAHSPVGSAGQGQNLQMWWPGPWRSEHALPHPW